MSLEVDPMVWLRLQFEELMREHSWNTNRTGDSYESDRVRDAWTMYRLGAFKGASLFYKKEKV